MSDERLKLKLVQAAYQEDVVSRLDRQTMMLTLATYMADQKEHTQATVADEEEESIGEFTDAKTQAGAISLEEKRLILEKNVF